MYVCEFVHMCNYVNVCACVLHVSYCTFVFMYAYLCEHVHDFYVCICVSEFKCTFCVVVCEFVHLCL